MTKQPIVFFCAIILHSFFMTLIAGALEAYPVPRTGFCPSGYHASGKYCVPNTMKSGAAIGRDGFCPQGYHASGNYCVANGINSGKTIYRDGFCPQGYHASGNYCIEN